jgi:ABC-type sugar transport system substrate-binding protein
MHKKPAALAAAALFATTALAAPSLQAAEPVKVGMVTTLSTGAGYLGDHARKGLELALEQSGAADKIELLVEDDGLDPGQATQLTQRMVERDGVKLMTGSIFSNVAMATVPKLVRNSDVVYVSPNAGPAPLAGKGCHPHYFNVAYQNDNIAEVVGQYATDQGYQRVYLMAPQYQAGKDSLAGFKRYFAMPPRMRCISSTPVAWASTLSSSSRKRAWPIRSWPSARRSASMTRCWMPSATPPSDSTTAANGRPIWTTRPTASSSPRIRPSTTNTRRFTPARATMRGC